MSDHLTLVRRPPLSARHIQVTTPYRKLALGAYTETGVAFCDDPEFLADRLCFDVCPTAEHEPFVLGRAMYVPDRLTLRQSGLVVVELIARARLIAAGLSADPAFVAAVAAEIALPRDVARLVSPGELGDVNPYLPIDYLREVYVCHRERSGEMPAVG